MHSLQPHDPANGVHFCSWFLQSVVEGEIDLQLTFFSNEAWFHLQGYINMQNNDSTSNPRSPAPSGESWYALSARRIVLCFFSKTINFERYLRLEG
jgi:hypothetical protein